MSDEAKLDVRPWERQGTETALSYAKFELFRDLGPTRQIKAAFDLWQAARTERTRYDTLQSWQQLASRLQWYSRAREFDVLNFGNRGFNVVALFMQALEAAATKLVKELETNDRVKPINWYEAINGLATIGAFIPAETVAGLSDHARSGGATVPAIGATSGQPSGDYRAIIAALEARPIDDGHAPSQAQDSNDGPTLGQDDNGQKTNLD